MLLERFCCSDLRTGTYRYAIIMLVFSIIAALASLFYQDSITETHQYNGHYLWVYRFCGQVVSIAVSIALAYGAKKKNRILLLPYLILQGVSMIVGTGICVIFLSYSPAAFLGLLICAPFWYIWLCVLSFFQSLDPKKRNCAPQTIQSDDVVVHMDQPPSYEDCPQKGKNAF